MRNFLWWCIWLFVSSQWSVASGLWQPSPRLIPPDKTDAPQKENNGQQTTGNGLSCQISSPICLQTLGDLARQNNRELVVLEQSLRLQKKKLWTSWLNADGLNPLAMGLRLARNMIGGGERAARQLEIARLELRRAELITNLYQAVARALAACEQAQEQQAQAQARWAAQRVRLQFAEAAYRLGESSTEAMLVLWQAETEAHARQGRTEQQVVHAQARLLHLVFPPRLAP